MSELRSKDQSKSVALNLRVAEDHRALIDAAIEIVGGDRTTFVLDAACKRAEQVLLEQRQFLLEGQTFDQFSKALEEHPIRSNACVNKLLARPKRWDCR